MKYLILGILFFLSSQCYSQRVERFIDSLALNSERTWIDKSGTKFTKIGDNCNYGLEITFKKQGSRVIFHQCHQGEWKEFVFEFKVTGDEGEHFIEIYKDNKKLDDYEFEVQMVSEEQNIFKTELTLFEYGTKSHYILQSTK